MTHLVTGHCRCDTSPSWKYSVEERHDLASSCIASTKPKFLTEAFVGAYLLYTWGNQEFERLKRKNPADYENDQ
ncbi:PREDICTED: cytochrome b-c1 complex subunit 8 [Charadrius vociferus]|uniref:cytochrome b-c1 complex subunit 8 n=1 Tax=Charadrius vociferus TaxID=50402 RepID=UPI00052171DC|nr:PREDICTED: cytochrome b-c1 complex subunit 8 [Charadrius vociferus]